MILSCSKGDFHEINEMRISNDIRLFSDESTTSCYSWPWCFLPGGVNLHPGESAGGRRSREYCRPHPVITRIERQKKGLTRKLWWLNWLKYVFFEGLFQLVSWVVWLFNPLSVFFPAKHLMCQRLAMIDHESRTILGRHSWCILDLEVLFTTLANHLPWFFSVDDLLFQNGQSTTSGNL